MSEETILEKENTTLIDSTTEPISQQELSEVNNSVTLIGVMRENFYYNHKIGDERFYKSWIKVKRTSGVEDVIPVVVSETILNGGGEGYKGKFVKIVGQLLSCDVYGSMTSGNPGHHLRTSVCIEEISEIADDGSIENNNIVILKGGICKKFFKVKFSGTQVTELLIHVNRTNGRRAYISCIAWHNKAYWANKKLNIGDEIMVIGRLQSRKYSKVDRENPENVTTNSKIEVGLSQIFVV